MSDSLNFLKPYLRGWPIIITAMLISFSIANKYLNYVTPMYESTAKLRMADMNEGIPNSNLFKDLDVFATSQKINSEIELLKSNTLIEKALHKIPFQVQIFREGSIRKTELFNQSPVVITPINWTEDQLDKNFKLEINDTKKYIISAGDQNVFKGKIGDTLKINKSLIIIQLNDSLIASKNNIQVVDTYSFTVLSVAKQIAQVSSSLDVIAVDKDVPVIRISYKSAHPDKAALLPNALAQAYIEDYIENKYSAADITVNFLDERIAEMRAKLEESEQEILNYRDDNKITNIRQETETDLRKVSQLEIQRTNLKMSLEAIKDLENYITSGKDKFLELAPNFEAFTDLLSTEIIKNIKQLQAEKRDLLLVYTDKDERVIVIDDKINDLSSYLIESIKNTRKNLQTKFDKLATDISDAEETFLGVPEKEMIMTILNREFEIFQQSYNFLNQKKIEAEIAKAAKMAFHRVITPAVVSSDPVSPNRIIIKVVSVILGMMGAIIFIFIVHGLKARVNDIATVLSNSMLPIVAAVPKLKNPMDKELFFVKTLAEWEVKKFIKEEGISCLTSFNNKHAAKFIAEQLKDVWQLQSKKILLVKFQKEIEIQSDVFYKLVTKDSKIDTLIIAQNRLKAISTNQWQQFLKTISKGYEQMLILNSVFGQSHTLATMAIADFNVVCLDTRLTPAKLIVEVDLMKEEFDLPNVFLAVNRVEYNPSFIRESIMFFRQLFSKKNTNSKISYE